MNLVLSKPLVGCRTQPLLHDKERWYVVSSQPCRERLAARQPANQGYRSFLRHLKNRWHARKFETLVVPLFPRYLFGIIDQTAIAGDPAHARIKSRAGAA
jgi:hypothetical protein